MKSLDNEDEKPAPRCSLDELRARVDASLNEARAAIQAALVNLASRPPLGIRSGGDSCPAQPSYSRESDDEHDDRGSAGR